MGSSDPGKLRIYLGNAAGVGKTYAMLCEGHRRAERGTDVVIGFVETHGRPHTAALIEGLEAVPRVLIWDGERAIGRWRAGKPELTAECPAFGGRRLRSRSCRPHARWTCRAAHRRAVLPAVIGRSGRS